MGGVLFEHIDLIDENFNFKKDMFLGVSGGRISYVGKEAPEGVRAENGAPEGIRAKNGAPEGVRAENGAPEGGEYKRVKGENLLACPAFYNAHTHLPMVLLRGYAENLALSDWLNKRVFPFEAQLTGEDVYCATLLAQAEMLRFGCVSSTEMYFRLPCLYKATAESKVKMNASNAIICFDDKNFEALREYREYAECLADPGLRASERFALDMAIHAEYTSNPAVVEKAAAMAKEFGMRMQLHLSETKAEHEECKARRGGLTPAAYFEKHGAFDVPCTAAHCVWLEDGDFEVLARKGVTAVNCPISNLKLASGFANVERLLKAGVNVALGTDGAASNNSLNLFEELKLFAVLNKAVSGDPTLITPAQAFYAATRAGALSQGRADCGLIREGFKADLFLLDTDRPYMCPPHDPLSNAVYSAQGSDVVLTMCDGEILYKNGEYTTIDVERARFETERRALRIAKTLGGN